MLEQYLITPSTGDLPPVLPISPLVVMKLAAGRYKDRADIIELFKRRTMNSIDEIEKFVRSYLPSQIEVFLNLVACVANERANEGIKIP
jgi:hypothetical protein